MQNGAIGTRTSGTAAKPRLLPAAIILFAFRCVTLLYAWESYAATGYSFLYPLAVYPISDSLGALGNSD